MSDPCSLHQTDELVYIHVKGPKRRDPQTESTWTHPVFAVKALTFEDEYLVYDYTSFSICHQAYFRCFPAEARPQSVGSDWIVEWKTLSVHLFIYQYAGVREFLSIFTLFLPRRSGADMWGNMRFILGMTERFLERLISSRWTYSISIYIWSPEACVPPSGPPAAKLIRG